MASVTLDRLTKRFASGRPAVRDLSLDVADGELLVIVGPSGCGKSTVLRLVAGLEMPTSGHVAIDGADVTGVTPQARDVAMVFQSYALYPHMTVRENLAFGLRVRGAGREAREAAVQRTSKMLGLEGLLDRRPAQLSGGQRQRVAVGRALARDARVYLLDEPLSNLDPLLRIETRTELGLLHRQIGATMLYVTHDQEEAMTLGTRIALMRDGALEQVGAPMALYREPVNRFVASFIGAPAINIVPGVVRQDGGGRRVVAPAFRRPVDHAAAGVGAEGQAVDVGFRPQDADVCAEAEADAVGYVQVAEPMGPHTLLHVETEGADGRLRIAASPDRQVRAGDRIGFCVRRDRLHLFDSASGTRLH